MHTEAFGVTPSLLGSPVRGFRGLRGIAFALGVYLVTVAIGVAALGRVLAHPLAGTLFGAVFLLAAVTVWVFWRFSEFAYARQEQYRRELFDAEMGALARLREANQMREDIIASVSHEFRTPLTAIRGSATTLRSRADQLRPSDRETLLAGILEHSDRLSRLLENILLAASATGSTDSGAIADVTGALAQFSLGTARPPVERAIEPGLAAYIDVVTLDQVVRALADHVRTESRRDRPVLLAARRQAAEIVVDLSYAGWGGDDDLRRLFEPFGDRQSATTGRPASLALYVVRRLVEAQGGRASATRDGDLVRVRVALRTFRSRAGRPAPPVADCRPGIPATAVRALR